MVKVQLNIPEYLNRFLGIQKEIYGVSDKREAIIRIIDEKLSKDKKLMNTLKKQSREVRCIHE